MGNLLEDPGDERPPGELQDQLDSLREQVSVNRGEIDALREGAKEASQRADVSEAHADDSDLRLDDLEDAVDLDRAMIVELQAKGLVSTEHAAQLQEALLSARTIGAAVGLVMANRLVTEAEAFALLVRASQHTNRKIRLLARDLVDTGDLTILPS